MPVTPTMRPDAPRQRASFESIDYWKDEVLAKANPHVCKLLVGAKADLADLRAVSEEEGRAAVRDAPPRTTRSRPVAQGIATPRRSAWPPSVNPAAIPNSVPTYPH